MYTDHSACLSLLNTPRPSGKLARWAMTVQEMNLTLKHRSGRQNANADVLSRNPLSEEAKSVGSVNTCEELECSSDNMCSVGVVQSVAHSLRSDDHGNKNHVNKKGHANESADHANDPDNHANVSGDRADGSSGSSVDTNDNCPRKNAESVNQAHVAVGDTSSVADGGVTAVTVGDADATGDCFGEKQDVKLKENLAEIRELQLKYPDLAFYFTYLT